MRGLGLLLPGELELAAPAPGPGTAAALSSVKDALLEDRVERPKLAARGGNGRLHLSGWITPHVLISHSAKSINTYIQYTVRVHMDKYSTNTSIPNSAFECYTNRQSYTRIQYTQYIIQLHVQYLCTYLRNYNPTCKDKFLYTVHATKFL